MYLVYTGVCVPCECVRMSLMLIKMIQVALLSRSHKPVVIREDMDGSQMADHFQKFVLSET